jgi:OFA family oxalate/formate antiporter-like MFS transporter
MSFYGGITPTNSAFVNDFYGSDNYDVNLSLINMNLFIASFGSSIKMNLIN